MNENLQVVFTEIHDNQIWKSNESKSGSGSELRNTALLRDQLEIFLKISECKKIVDLPCGDFNWMSKIDLQGATYIGVDIVEELIKKNREQYPTH